MPTSVEEYESFLRGLKLRHHVDHEQSLIRVVFVTHEYRNLRDEKLAIVEVESLDDGQRVRACIPRAFAPGRDPAAVCFAACRLAADTPLVGVEFDAECENLRLVTDVPVADGVLTPGQLDAMIGRLVDAAELWAPVILAMQCIPPEERDF